MRVSQLWILLAALACSDDERQRWERSEFTDDGSLCVRTGAAGELLIDVVVEGCASGCTRIVDSACEVDADDAEIVVHGSITSEERQGPGLVCPTVCVPIGATCAPVQVSPGEYLFRYGGHASTASLPTDTPFLLGGGDPAALGCR